MIEIKNLTKIYNKPNTIYANNNISLKIENSSIVGLLGTNGSGKTTLIKAMCNLVTPTKGEILIDGININRNPQVVHKNVGVVLEGARNLYNFLTVNENISYFSYLNKLNKAYVNEQKEKYLKLFGLEDKANAVVNTLSRGMQQKVAIIIAVLKDPSILILDEPTLGLDIISTIKMQELLKSLAEYSNKTLIISSHDMSVIEAICDKIIILDKGKVKKYDTVSNLKFSKRSNIYNIILENNTEVLEKINKLQETYENADESYLKIRTCNLDEIIKEISAKYIIKIEKDFNKIEDLFGSKESLL